MGALQPDTHNPKNVHQVLAYSYATYFIFFLLGIVVDILFPYRIMPAYVVWIGTLLLFLSTVLVLWAQHTSSILDHKKGQYSSEDFHKGPYRFTRSPTHVGLGLLLFGTGFIFNSIFIVALTAIPLIFAHFVFVRKMEDVLDKKYGDIYRSYKNKVKKII